MTSQSCGTSLTRVAGARTLPDRDCSPCREIPIRSTMLVPARRTAAEIPQAILCLTRNSRARYRFEGTVFPSGSFR